MKLLKCYTQTIFQNPTVTLSLWQSHTGYFQKLTQFFFAKCPIFMMLRDTFIENL